MSETKKNIIVGFTAIASMLCLLAMLLLFGWVPQMLDKGYPVRVNLPDAGGLYEGARAWYGGVEVGQVEGVERQNPLRPSVRVVVKVEEDVDLPAGLSAYVYEPLIGGAPRLILELPPDAGGELVALPRDGSALIEGRYLSRLASMVGGEAGDQIDGLMTEADAVMGSARSLAATWDEVGQQLVAITAARSPESVDAGQAEGNLYSLLARADARAAELKEVLAAAQNTVANADALISDPELQADVRQTAQSAAQLTSTAAAAVPRVEKKLNDTLDAIDGRLDEALGSLKTQYTAVAQEVSAAMASYQALAEDVRAGKGTTGKLVQDPALYNNLNDAVERLQTAIDTFTATMETWTKDGLPVKL